MSVLQQAWDDAQPRLHSIRESIRSLTTPHARILRVGQLDAELLDQELVHLLQDPLNKALASVHSTFRSRFEPELSLLIQLTLYKFSVWDTGASYGAKLQELRYLDARTRSGRLTPSGIPARILVVHGALTILIPYIHTRIRSHALSKAWPDAPSSDRRRKTWELLTSLESTHALLSLVSFVAFLWDGRYRTLVDRLLGLHLAPARRLVKRDVSYEFMNRQMVWHAFTEFLLFILPLLPHRTLRRFTSSIISYLSHPLDTVSRILPAPAKSALGISPSVTVQDTASSSKRGPFYSLSENECAICAENTALNLNLANPTASMAQASAQAVYSLNIPASSLQSSSANTEDSDEPPPHPIHTPYRTSCGHVYCYVCLAEKMLRAADEGGPPWECLRCTELVRGAQRVKMQEYWVRRGGDDGEGSETESQFGSDYFDELGSSVSGVSGMTMGSRSWISGSDEGSD